ncbi:MAG TPA: hypothetical protein EYG51_07450 [Pseudomonadales bacterium]|nr:hypothetical protein [Pseudomonadales bacterium]
MNKHLLYISSVIVLLSIHSYAGDNVDYIDKLVSQGVQNIATQNDISFSETDGKMVVNGVLLKIKPVVENVIQKEGMYLSGVKYEVSIADKNIDSLTFGSIGIDETHDLSLKQSTLEWFMQFGTPLITAVGKKRPV